MLPGRGRHRPQPPTPTPGLSAPFALALHPQSARQSARCRQPRLPRACPLAPVHPAPPQPAPLQPHGRCADAELL